MATPPRPPQQPPRPNPPSPPPKPAAQHEPQRDSHAERKAERKAERDEEEVPPDDVTTTQEDQLDRSAEMEAMGVEPWKEAHDERNDAEQHHARRGGAVPGVSPTQKDDPGRKP